jgi:hypothetical protein
LRPADEVDASAAALALTQERREAIAGAMRGVRLDYVPAWAANLPEERWRQSAALVKAHGEQGPRTGAGL